MTLAQFLADRCMTQEAFSEAIGVSRFAVGKWVRGERMPRPDQIRRIVAATGGEVTANDFFGAPHTSEVAA